MRHGVGKICVRALWCIMLKPSITTSQTVSCTARWSIRCAWSFGEVSVMPRARNFPFSFSRNKTGAMVEGVVIHRRGDNVQLEHVNVVVVELTQGVLEARYDPRRRNGCTAAIDQGFRSDDNAVTRHRFDRFANQRFGAIGSGSIQEIEPHIQRLTH